MVAIVFLHLAAAAVVLAGPSLPRRGLWALIAVPPIGSAIWLATQPLGTGQAMHSERFEWVPGLGLSYTFQLDGFAQLMALVVTLIAVLVVAFSAGYFEAETDSNRLARFAGGFVGFAGSMLGLVFAADVWTFFIFWELTTISSFVLIGLDDRLAPARAAARRALLTTGAGGLALLGGLAILSKSTGSTAFADLANADLDSTVVQVGLGLALVGAVTKSAQFPFRFWLPGAMAAPTPISAFLHSATMVKAGIVLIARLAPMFAQVEWWRPSLVIIGGTTMIVGGISALRQSDAKLLLAHGTVSQLGFMTLLFGFGSPATTAAGVAVLVGHALFKAALFLIVGIVEHITGTRDLRQLGGLARNHRWLALVTALATLSMIGFPPLFGFLAKETALHSLFEAGTAWARVALIATVAGSILTVAYSLRLLLGIFFGPPPEDAETQRYPISPALFLPPMALALGGLSAGLLAAESTRVLSPASESLDHAAHVHLSLWSGLEAPLLTSAAIVLAGCLLHHLLVRADPAPAQKPLAGQRIFDRIYDGALNAARRVTAVAQNGSLPAYIAAIFILLAIALVYSVSSGTGLGPADLTNGGSLQTFVALLAAIASIGIIFTARRFVSVLMLGAVGYSISVIWMLYGAPDLALTQFLVETISLLVFLLVLRHLPEGYSPPPQWAPKSLRVAIALAVGMSVAWFATAAGTARTDHSVADQAIAEAKPIGGGRNVVNVILIDIRGIDTSGEIAVLAIAAAGVANLVRAARQRTGSSNSEGPTSRVDAQSVIFDQVTRAAFPVMLTVSIYVALRGHNAPGGGFAGGLIAGAAFAMRFLAGNSPVLARRRQPAPFGLVGAGLATAIGAGLAGTVSGSEYLDLGVSHVHLPLIGDVELVSAAIFDGGVYLVVLGVVMSLLIHLGAEATQKSPGPPVL